MENGVGIVKLMGRYSGMLRLYLHEGFIQLRSFSSLFSCICRIHRRVCYIGKQRCGIVFAAHTESLDYFIYSHLLFSFIFEIIIVHVWLKMTHLINFTSSTCRKTGLLLDPRVSFLPRRSWWAISVC